MKHLTLLCGLAAPIVFSGCMSPDTYTDPEPLEREAWSLPAAEGEAPYWNSILQDPQLDALVAEALANNTDLRIAAQRVELARAQFRIQRSERSPDLNAIGSFERGENTAGVSESWGALLSVPAWEIDLWGRVRDLTESAQQRFLAEQFNRRAVEVSLTAQVAEFYLGLVSLDRQAAIAEATLQSRRDSQVIIEDRHRAGIASQLDRQQAVILTETAVRTLEELQRLRTRQANALSILIGRGPGSVAHGATLFETVVPPRLPAGLPSELLSRRPDIQAAEAQLAAARLDVSAARKTFLPSFSLTGFAGYLSGDFDDLFDSQSEAWNVAPAAALPLFNRGRLRANLQANEAARAIAAEAYVFTVRNAFGEVENALTDHRSYLLQTEASQSIVEASRERLALTEKRYKEGVSNYFEVLDANRQLFANELDYVRNYQNSLTSVIGLYRALGAEWMPEPEVEKADGSSEAPQPAANCPVCNPV